MKKYFCDECEKEVEPEGLYIVDDGEKELCDECVLLRYETVAEREEKE